MDDNTARVLVTGIVLAFVFACLRRFDRVSLRVEQLSLNFFGLLKIGAKMLDLVLQRGNPRGQSRVLAAGDSSIEDWQQIYVNFQPVIMPWLIGQRSRALIYTGDAIDSAEAYRLGLVDKVFPKETLHAEVMKIAKRMSRVSADCLKWNKRAINQTSETMGLRSSIMYGAEASAIMDSTSSLETEMFDKVRRTGGLGAALKWRTEQFAPYE